MRKLEIIVTLVALSGLLIITAEAAEEYYTWVDENGITNYSEREPVGYQTTHVTEDHRFGYRKQPRQFGQPVEEAPAETTEDTDEPPPAEGIDPDLAIAEEKARLETELAAERKHNCDLGKQNLVRLETYARIRVEDDDGKLRYLTSEEMAKKKKEARDAIKFHCR